MATKYKWTSKEVARLATLNGFTVTRSTPETRVGEKSPVTRASCYWAITSPNGTTGWGLTLESAYWRMRGMASAQGIAWKYRKEVAHA